MHKTGLSPRQLHSLSFIKQGSVPEVLEFLGVCAHARTGGPDVPVVSRYHRLLHHLYTSASVDTVLACARSLLVKSRPPIIVKSPDSAEINHKAAIRTELD